LPTAAGGRLTYRPRAGGRADVVAAVGESGILSGAGPGGGAPKKLRASSMSKPARRVAS
jgi:hypothetical protein